MENLCLHDAFTPSRLHVMFDWGGLVESYFLPGFAYLVSQLVRDVGVIYVHVYNI